MNPNLKDLKNAVEFYEKAKNETGEPSYGVYKDAVEWVLESATRLVKEVENGQNNPS